jgi:putative drug exporter of the RND superfamily
MVSVDRGSRRAGRRGPISAWDGTLRPATLGPGLLSRFSTSALIGISSDRNTSTSPVLIFAIVFGLSVDHQVFLVSRMHEEWRRTGDASHAVRERLSATGGVITAAGAIIIVVFGAFVLSPDLKLKQFGPGLGVAVLLDAVIIRCLIVPAVMQLFGRRAWHLPRSLGRVQPTVALEPDAAPHAVLMATGPAGAPAGSERHG